MTTTWLRSTFRAHGLSGRWGGRPTFDGMAQAVIDAVAHVNAGPAHLIGTSFGGVHQCRVVAVPIITVMLLLASRADIMGGFAISGWRRGFGWAAAAVMAVVVVAMLATTT